MKRIPLNDFVDDRGQVSAATALAVTQGAVSKALRSGREIYVIEHDDGSYSAEELRPFPALPKQVGRHD